MHESSPEITKPGKKVAKKVAKPETTKTEPSLIKHVPEFEILDLEPKEVEVIEQKREKPDEKESVFVRGKLKKASLVKRPIEEPKLPTVDLVSHDNEELPISEVVSVN